MSNDPRSYQSGGYDQTRPISPLPQSANQQVPPSSYNQQIPDYGLPGQNAFSQERNPVRKRGLNKVLVGVILSVLVVIIVVGAVVIGKQINSYNSVVSKYYAAVQQQDYPKAYSYISFPGAFTAQGVRLYTAVAQGLDKSNGPVSSYSQQSSSDSGDNATVIETVQRQSRSYTVRLTLISVNGEWKITNFSSI